MNHTTRWASAIVGVGLLLSAHFAVCAEETVTIPKSRLQELERKEAELEKLKGQLHETKGENLRLKQQAEAATVIPIEAQHASPALASLPPLQSGEVVDALDLFNHYRADVNAAAQRYGKKTLLVRGTVIGFDKPLFARPYHILLRTTDRSGRVICKFELPDKFNAAFTVKNGTELVGESGSRARVTLAKVGDEITVQGTCKGFSDGSVILTGCETK